MLRLVRFLKGHVRAAVCAPCFKFLEALFELIVPLVVAKIIDVGIAGGDTAYVYKMVALMIALGAFGLAFCLVCQYLAAYASMHFGANVRTALYKHINRFDFAALDKFGAPSLVTRLTNDVNLTQQGVAMFIRLVLRSPFIAVGSIVMAISIDLKMSLIFILMSIVVSIVLYLLMSRSAPYYKRIQTSLDDVALLTRENLSGTRVVRAFSRQAEEERDFLHASVQVSKLSRRVGVIAGLLNPFTYVIVNLAVIAVLYFGGIQVNSGTLTQGQILALVNYLAQILLSLVVLANLIVMFTKASACAARINEVLDTQPAMQDNVDVAPPKREGSLKISFQNVNFSYGDNMGHTLENINLEISDGQTVGIIGATGSGKSTLVNLIGRFYDVTSGAVMLDGWNVKDYPLGDLRKKIAYCMQGSKLFYGTVRENICWGNPNASDDDVWQALRLALAEEFVAKLEHGLDTLVLADGKNFSGGQRQRLCIARALVRRPDILVLDDSSSALDYATDAALRKSLKSSCTGMTVIIISQRSSSIRHADKIFVVEDGKIVAIGKHDQLVNTCPVYEEITSFETPKSGGQQND